MRDKAGTAATPAVRCKNLRRGSFIGPLPEMVLGHQPTSKFHPPRGPLSPDVESAPGHELAKSALRPKARYRIRQADIGPPGQSAALRGPQQGVRPYRERRRGYTSTRAKAFRAYERASAIGGR